MHPLRSLLQFFCKLLQDLKSQSAADLKWHFVRVHCHSCVGHMHRSSFYVLLRMLRNFNLWKAFTNFIAYK